MLLTGLIFLILFSILIYKDYLYFRGKYLYSVLIGIKEDDDSIEDIRIYANNSTDAKYIALKKYKDDLIYNDKDIVIYAIEKI